MIASKVMVPVAIMILAALVGSNPARPVHILGIDRFLRNVTSVLHQIEDNVRPPFPTAWFQVTLVLALVWLLAPLFVNFWDSTIRASKRATDRPDAQPKCPWIHTVLQGFDKFLQLFRDQHTAARHQALVDAITRVGNVFAEEALVQARQQRDNAIERYGKLSTDKSVVDGELKDAMNNKEATLARCTELEASNVRAERQLRDNESSLSQTQAKLEKAEADLGHAKREISRLLMAADNQTSRANQEMVKRLDDIERRTKKLEEDAGTMAKKQAVLTSGGNDE